jgi:hypothetical protein
MTHRKKSWHYKLAKTIEFDEHKASEKLRTTLEYMNAAKFLCGEIVPEFKNINQVGVRTRNRPSKIHQALRNVPETPELLSVFAERVDVGENILRQYNRFIRDMNLHDVGNIVIKKNKTDGNYWIYKIEK